MPKELILKQYDSEVKAIEGERALSVTITTNDVDRSGDIVEPKGAKLTNFKKNPVVLMSHDYSGLPIGRATDLAKSDNSITAKVVFPEEGTYPLADTVFNLYKQGFMKAWSIGFIPIKSEDITDDEEKDSKTVRYGKRFKTWELLEFSACAVPANPHALTNMLSKGINVEPLKEAGFIEIEEKIVENEDLVKEVCPKCGADIADDDNPEYSSCSKCDWDDSDVEKGETTDLVLIKDIVNKPEETDDSIRIPAKGEEGKHKGHKIRWITVSSKEGIKGIYCIDCKKIITFVFDKKKGWTLEKAKKWMEDHGKTIEDYFQKVDWDTEYEDEDIDYKELEKDIFTEEEVVNASPTEMREFNANEIYDIVKENKELKEKLEAIELKAGAVLNAKNKGNLKQAQDLIQSVLDSAGATEEDSEVAVDDNKNNSKGDDDVVDIVVNTVNSPVIDEEKDKAIEEEELFKAKIDAIINQSMADVKKHFENKINYAMGRVVK
jgi:HK97 family phage prohead protease